MKFKKIKSSDSKEFEETWKIYESSFSFDERREFNAQVKLFLNNKYSFYAVYDKRLVGIITIWNLTTFLLIEHFAVKKDKRGKGIGTRLLKEYLNKANKTVVVEVERPNITITQQRIEFYKRIGFKLNKYDYIQPSYGAGKNPVPMFLMTFPNEIKESEFILIRKKIHTEVYGLKEPIICYKN